MGLLPWQRGSLPDPLPTYGHLPNGWHRDVSLLALKSYRMLGRLTDRPGTAGLNATRGEQHGLSLPLVSGSPEVNPFSAKYDDVMAGKAEFTPEEKAGYELFRGKTTHCNECRRDGGPGEEPLFTDFTASNLGLPRNPDLPF